LTGTKDREIKGLNEMWLAGQMLVGCRAEKLFKRVRILPPAVVKMYVNGGS
jgi:hypothetical protein